MPNNADKSSDKSIEQWLWDAACSIRGAKARRSCYNPRWSSCPSSPSRRIVTDDGSSSNSVTTISGGANLDAEHITIGGDVVGRDKIIQNIFEKGSTSHVSDDCFRAIF